MNTTAAAAAAALVSTQEFDRNLLDIFGWVWLGKP